MTPSESIRDHFENLEADESWSFADCTRKDTAKWTHGYHRYPAKFIPQIVEKLFDEYLTEDDCHVNDPFFGSGTTVVSAIARGFRASGTDINGIAYLMTKVKSNPIRPEYLSQKVDEFLSEIKPPSKGQVIRVQIPEEHVERIDYWFTPEMKVELGRIFHHIHQEPDQKIREFLLVGFSHILKNCSIWLQKSTKPTRDPKKITPEPYDALRKHLQLMVRGNKTFYSIVPEKMRKNLDELFTIRMGDARDQPVPDNSVDLIVSSSPYVTSYEYADLHQLSTLWLDFAPDLKEYRKKFVGSTYRDETRGLVKSEIAEDIVHQFKKKNLKMSESVRKFFADMEEVFLESYRILKNNGCCCFIIGNTELKGVHILNAQVFAESLQHCGFKLDRVIKRRIPSKILPQTRDKETGRFTSSDRATYVAYPVEYIVIGRKD